MLFQVLTKYHFDARMRRNHGPRQEITDQRPRRGSWGARDLPLILSVFLYLTTTPSFIKGLNNEQ